MTDKTLIGYQADETAQNAVKLGAIEVQQGGIPHTIAKTHAIDSTGSEVDFATKAKQTEIVQSLQTTNANLTDAAEATPTSSTGVRAWLRFIHTLLTTGIKRDWTLNSADDAVRAVQSGNWSVGVNNLPTEYALPTAQLNTLTPQTDALTNAQLRETPLPLPTGAATDAKQDAIVAAINSMPHYSKQYDTAVLLNEVPNAQLVEFFGYNAGVTNAATELIMPDSTATNTDFLLTTTLALQIASTSAVDAAPSGTGARTVQVVYVDNNLVVQTVTVNLNGNTAVTIAAANAWRMVISARVLTFGTATTPWNIGDIYIGTGTPATGRFPNPYCVIPAKASASSQTTYCVPANKKLIIAQMNANCTTNGVLHIVKFANAANAVRESVYHVQLVGSDSYVLPFEFVAGDVIGFCGTSYTTTAVGFGFSASGVLLNA